VHEADANKGGASLDDLVAECRTHCARADAAERIFDRDAGGVPIITWVRVRDFQLVSLRLIVAQLLSHLRVPEVRRSLSHGSHGSRGSSDTAGAGGGSGERRSSDAAWAANALYIQGEVSRTPLYVQHERLTLLYCASNVGAAEVAGVLRVRVLETTPDARVGLLTDADVPLLPRFYRQDSARESRTGTSPWSSAPTRPSFGRALSSMLLVGLRHASTLVHSLRDSEGTPESSARHSGRASAARHSGLARRSGRAPQKRMQVVWSENVCSETSGPKGGTSTHASTSNEAGGLSRLPPGTDEESGDGVSPSGTTAEAVTEDDDGQELRVLLLYLNDQTFTDLGKTAALVRYALEGSLRVLLVHEQSAARGARPFAHFLRVTVRAAAPAPSPSPAASATPLHTARRVTSPAVARSLAAARPAGGAHLPHARRPSVRAAGAPHRQRAVPAAQSCARDSNSPPRATIESRAGEPLLSVRALPCAQWARAPCRRGRSVAPCMKSCRSSGAARSRHLHKTNRARGSPPTRRPARRARRCNWRRCAASLRCRSGEAASRSCGCALASAGAAPSRAAGAGRPGRVGVVWASPARDMHVLGSWRKTLPGSARLGTSDRPEYAEARRYDADATRRLDEMWAAGWRAAGTVRVRRTDLAMDAGFVYIVDLASMTQRNERSGKVRQLMRLQASSGAEQGA
jgi:hypothetical protein